MGVGLYELNITTTWWALFFIFFYLRFYFPSVSRRLYRSWVLREFFFPLYFSFRALWLRNIYLSAHAFLVTNARQK